MNYTFFERVILKRIVITSRVYYFKDVTTSDYYPLMPKLVGFLGLFFMTFQDINNKVYTFNIYLSNCSGPFIMKCSFIFTGSNDGSLVSHLSLVIN